MISEICAAGNHGGVKTAARKQKGGETVENISYERFLQDFRHILAVELDQQLDAKLEEKLEEKLEAKLEEKLDAKFDERLKPIIDRLDRMELEQQRTNKKLDNLDIKVSETNRKVADLDLKVARIDLKVCEGNTKISALELSMKRSEKAIRSDITKLKDANDTLAAVLEAHGMIPGVK